MGGSEIGNMKNSPSLDSSIQSALSALYPPFEATAPTVLSQLFQVIEEQYKGDALRCLLHFLIPAKRLLETVRQAACVEYCDRLFRCEGWPLCLREQVVVQLAPIDPLLLHPGDFYLQVEPFANQAARIVLKSPLGGRQEVEVTAVPETLYTSIFTEEWLRGVNKGRHGVPLRHCVLCTDDGIVKVPWVQVAKPEFVDKPKTMATSTAVKECRERGPQPPLSPFSVETRILPAKDGIAVSVRLVDTSGSRVANEHQDAQAAKPVGQVSPSSWDNYKAHELEGDYVDLVEFNEEKKALALGRTRTQSQHCGFSSIRQTVPLPGDPSAHMRGVRFSKELCTPCSWRKVGQDSRIHGGKGRHRESYMAALQNPVIFGSKVSVPDPCSTSKKPGSDREPQLLAQNHHPGEMQSHSPLKSGSTNSEAQPPSQTTAVETSRNFPAALTLGVGSNRDVCPEVMPILSVLESKKGTTFGLVSPKLERRRNAEEARPPQPATPWHRHGGHRNSSQAVKSFTCQAPSCSSRGSHKLCSSLLQLGLACLPGSRDCTGRAVVELYGGHQGWRTPLCSSSELYNLLLYYHSVLRKEVADLGITLVMDSRNRPPPPAFCKALQMLQEHGSQIVHCVLILVEKDTSPSVEKPFGLPMEVVTSLKALQKVVEMRQLTPRLDGTFLYSHSEWLRFYQKFEPFALDLREAAHWLRRAIGKLDSIPKTDTVQDVRRCVREQSVLMGEVLEDSRLVFLQREGGAILTKLRKEQLRFPHSEDYRDAMDSVTSLYNHVEEQVHLLVTKSNESLQHLEFLLNLRDLESRMEKIWEWFLSEGEQQLKEASSIGETSAGADQLFQSFSSFLAVASEHKHQAVQLMSEAEKIQLRSYPEAEAFNAELSSFRCGLADFWSRAVQCHAELGTMVQLQHFCEKATSFAEECKQYLELLGGSETVHMNMLKKYREQLNEFSTEQFHHFRNHACMAKHSTGMQIWNLAWLRCQDVRQLLENRLQSFDESQQTAVETLDLSSWVIEEAAPPAPSLSGSRHAGHGSTTLPEDRSQCSSESDDVTISCFKISFRPDGKECKLTKTSADSRKDLKIRVGKEEKCSLEKVKEPSGVQGGLGVQGHQIAERFTSKNSNVGNSPWLENIGSSASCDHRRRSLEDPRGADGGNSPDQQPLSRQGYPATPKCEGTVSQGPASEAKNSSGVLKLRRIAEELLLTEREYVRSLGYVVTHYCPLLEQADVPQDLRGQRGCIFGNLEKLHDFHRHVFLPDLDACLCEPLHVGRYFLRHREKFGLYALYSKNKPQSDSLLTHRGQEFFKQKQLELGDKMDLSSYLLKPVQRISKYSLLLQDMLKECETQTNGERGELQAALEVVQFQLRHGNDLLAMDDIQGCDVNLKEQGQLIRQDEFLVSFRKKKRFRHVFLFQDLILFSKTKKTEVGNDVYVYKQSFKTSEIGLTHNSGTSGLCFEIWFRRRKVEDTYILQARSSELKEAWTIDLEQLLWQQAVHNREIRMQERVFMGFGNKPFLDIQPSDAAISNRAINCVLAGRDKDILPRSSSIGSGSSASFSGSQSSSSSGRGSLPPNGYLSNQFWRGSKGPEVPPAPRALEEDDLDNDNRAHLLIDSSESSADSVSGFSSSDHSCLSAIGGEVEDSSSVSSNLPFKDRVRGALPECQKCDCPELGVKRASIAPTPWVLPQKSEKVEKKVIAGT
ncbi:pleckstrin homology domain-containing family G member 4B-like [Arapaima gigas]